MAKQKKKRNKKYTGIDAKAGAPTVVRVQAEERSALKEWWLTYRRVVKIGGIAGGIVALIALLGIGIVGIFAGF